MKNFKFLSLIAVLTLCSSCTTYYYQVYNVESSSVPVVNNQFQYEDDNCIVSYDFWAESGDAGFVITNTSEKNLTIDLNKSFFVLNGMAFDYFQSRTWESSSKLEVVAGRTSTATAYGTWTISKMPGSISASAATTQSVSHGNSVAYVEKPTIIVPPHASKVVSEYHICDIIFENCSTKLFPSGKDKEIYQFDASSQPIFQNIISYTKEGEETSNVIDNTFKITSYQNVKASKCTKKEKIGCNAKEIKVSSIRDSKKFYNEYNSNYSNIYSKDAKTPQSTMF